MSNIAICQKCGAKAAIRLTADDGREMLICVSAQFAEAVLDLSHEARKSISGSIMKAKLERIKADRLAFLKAHEALDPDKAEAAPVLKCGSCCRFFSLGCEQCAKDLDLVP